MSPTKRKNTSAKTSDAAATGKLSPEAIARLRLRTDLPPIERVDRTAASARSESPDEAGGSAVEASAESAGRRSDAPVASDVATQSEASSEPREAATPPSPEVRAAVDAIAKQGAVDDSDGDAAPEAAAGEGPAPKKRPKKRALRRAQGKVRAFDGEAPSDAAEGEGALGDEATGGGSGDEATGSEPSEDAGEAAAAQDAPAAPRRRSVRDGASRGAKIAGIVFAAVAIVVIACFGVFSWDRWLRYDDAADFEGVWRLSDGANPVTVAEGHIDLSPEASFAYEIDPFAKTLSFSLGDMSGEAHYRFSADRSQIAIEDGGESWFGTMSDDLARAVQGVFAAITGGEAPALSDDPNAVVLTRDGAAADAEAGGEDPTAEDGSADAGVAPEGEGGTAESGDGAADEGAGATDAA